MWDIKDAHKWIMRPETVYERRRELRVRESRHTAILFDKKYYDIDSGKFITDKLNTLNSYSLNDLIELESNEVNTYKKPPRSSSNAWFVPKDNDWDEEIKNDDMTKEETIILIRHELYDYKCLHRDTLNRMNQIESAMNDFSMRIKHVLGLLDMKLKELDDNY